MVLGGVLLSGRAVWVVPELAQAMYADPSTNAVQWRMMLTVLEQQTDASVAVDSVLSVVDGETIERFRTILEENKV